MQGRQLRQIQKDRVLTDYTSDKEADNRLQYASTLGWEHLNLTGNYVWRQSRRDE